MICEEKYKPGFIFLGMTLPITVGMIVTSLLKYGNTSIDRHEFMFLTLKVIIILYVLYLFLNWLCENNYYGLAWSMTVIPLIIVAYVGYNMSIHVDCRNGMNMVLKHCLKK